MITDSYEPGTGIPEGKVEPYVPPSTNGHHRGEMIGEVKQEPPLPVFTLGEMKQAYPELRPPIIDELMRQGETMNIIAASKEGKSWLALDIALSVATGSRWLKRFNTTQSRVLYVDNELHPETLTSRLNSVVWKRSLDPGEVEQQLIASPLRGFGLTISGLERLLTQLEVNPPGLIVLDAFYRFMPEGTSENDNAHIMLIYNTLDRYARDHGCAFIIIHHSSKGNQTQKAVTDVGSGASSMSRAADTHMVIRPHDNDDLSVLETRCRSFAPLEPVSLFFTWPCWYVSTEEPVLKQRATPGKTQKEAERKADVAKVSTEYGTGTPFSWSDVRTLIGCGQDRSNGIIAFGIEAGDFEKADMIKRPNSKKETQHYRVTGTVTGTETGTETGTDL